MIRRLRARWQRFIDRLWWLYALLFPWNAAVDARARQFAVTEGRRSSSRR